jgi:hypothetical protein
LSPLDVAAIAVAGGCTAFCLRDLAPRPRKLWRQAVPPVLGFFASVLSMASSLDNLGLDLWWTSSLATGWWIGLARGRAILVETDQVWGTVRTPVAVDAAVAASCILLGAAVDGPPLCLAGALGGGFLAGRAWSLIGRAVQMPHTELGV